MNIKNSILAAALAAGVMGAATATPLPVVYISGSTAFRGPANQALINYVTNTPVAPITSWPLTTPQSLPQVICC